MNTILNSKTFTITRNTPFIYTFPSQKRPLYQSYRRFRTILSTSKRLYTTSQTTMLKTFHTDFLLKRAKQHLSLKPTTPLPQKKRKSHLFLTTSNSNNIFQSTSSTQRHIRKLRVPSLDFSQLSQSPPLKFNHNLRMCLEERGGRNKISHFFNQTLTARNLIQQKYSLLQDLNHINENIQFKEEGAESKKFTVGKTAKTLDVYIDVMHQYVSYLNNTIYSESVVLNGIYANKFALERELDQIKEMIKKKKKELVLYRHYKEFLLMVKYHVSKIEHLPLEIMLRYGLIDGHPVKKNDGTTKQNPRKVSRRFTNKTLFERRASRKLSTKIKSKEELKNFLNLPIFDSPDEFVQVFNAFESKTEKLFRTINEKENDNKDLALEKYKMGEKNDKLIIDTERINEKLEKELLVLKERYYKLKQSHCKAVNAENEGDHISPVVFEKIRDILVNLPLNIEMDFNEVNFYKHINAKNNYAFIKGKNCNRALYGLKVLEIILLHYERLKERYMSSSKGRERYIQVNNEIKRVKKFEKSILKKKEEEEQMTKKNQTIYDKLNKIPFIQKRKVDYLFDNPLMNLNLLYGDKRKNDKNKKDDIKKIYEDFLSY